jgi:phytoene dehydrogenase-like protein
MKKAIIIGSGFGGLGTACLLAKAGYEVVVLEKNEQPGGRASVYSEKGYTFDMGPSWYLMPDIFEHFFKLMGERVEDFLDLQKLQPSYRIFFKDDGQLIDIHSDLEKDLPTLEKLEPGSSSQVREYLKRSGYQYEIAQKAFSFQELRLDPRFFELEDDDRGEPSFRVHEDGSLCKTFFQKRRPCKRSCSIRSCFLEVLRTIRPRCIIL